MAGKEIAIKKYVVRLSSEECHQLETLIRKGKGSAHLPMRIASPPYAEPSHPKTAPVQ